MRTAFTSFHNATNDAGGHPTVSNAPPSLIPHFSMIGNGPVDYAAIRLSIAGLRAVTPASIAYLAACMIKHSWFFLPVGLLAASEAAFYLLVYLPRHSRLQAPPRKAPPRLTSAQRKALFDRCVAAESHGASTNLPYPRGWFLPNETPPRREDVVDWLLWALFSTSREQTNIEEHQEELMGYIESIERLLGTPLEPGRSNAQLRSMRITLDPVKMLHRPLLWYFVVALVDTYTSIILTSLGFQHYTPRDAQWRRTFPPRPVLYLLSRNAPNGAVTPYWLRPHTSSSAHPLVFLHGIGIGLYPYIPFVRSLISADRTVGILLPEMMSICMHMTPRSVPPREEMLVSLNLILESLRATSDTADSRQPLLTGAGWDRVVLSAHSYGTFVAGWVIREGTAPGAHSSGLNAKIAHLVLVDPIPILLSNPTVAHNFLYRSPSTVCPHRLGSTPTVEDAASPSPRAWYSAPAAWQLWYFASRDADVAHTLFRSFFWAEGGLWREDVDEWVDGGRSVAVVLGGKDQIVPSEAVRRYLTGEAGSVAHWVRPGETEARAMVGGYGSMSQAGPTRVYPRGKLEVLFNPALDHAVIFDEAGWTVPLIDVVRRYIAMNN